MINNFDHVVLLMAKKNGGKLEISKTDVLEFSAIEGEKLVIHFDAEQLKWIIEVVRDETN